MCCWFTHFLRVVIFHSDVNVYQRVGNGGIPSIIAIVVVIPVLHSLRLAPVRQTKLSDYCFNSSRCLSLIFPGPYGRTICAPSVVTLKNCISLSFNSARWFSSGHYLAHLNWMVQLHPSCYIIGEIVTMIQYIIKRSCHILPMPKGWTPRDCWLYFTWCLLWLNLKTPLPL